jgi:hypothetical protein
MDGSEELGSGIGGGEVGERQRWLIESSQSSLKHPVTRKEELKWNSIVANDQGDQIGRFFQNFENWLIAFFG